MVSIYMLLVFSQLTRVMGIHKFGKNSWNMFQGDSANCIYQRLIQTDFDRAMGRLHEIDLVCFWDDMDGCISQLRSMLHLPTPWWRRRTAAVRRRTNDARHSDKVGRAMQNETLREMVASANSADMVLYRWARRNYYDNKAHAGQPSPAPATTPFQWLWNAFF